MMLELTLALQLQPHILIEDTCRINLVPNMMLLVISKFNYNVIITLNVKSPLPYWEVKLMCDSHYYVLGKEG